MKQRLMPLNKRFKTAMGDFIQAGWTGTNESGWEPMGDRVIIFPDQGATATASGKLVIPENISERQTLSAVAGVVVALGPQCTVACKPGDRVFTEKFAGELVPGHDGLIYRIMSEACIGAIYKPSGIIK